MPYCCYFSSRIFHSTFALKNSFLNEAFGPPTLPSIGRATRHIRLTRFRGDEIQLIPNCLSFLCKPSRVMPSVFAALVLLWLCSRSASKRTYFSTVRSEER